MFFLLTRNFSYPEWMRPCPDAWIIIPNGCVMEGPT